MAIGIVTLIFSVGLIATYFENLGNKSDTNNIVRVACVGDSITEWSKYPTHLQVMLGENYEVGNFGVAGSAVLLNSDEPYMHQTAFQSGVQFEPSTVVIMLGTNDARENNIQYVEDFTEDYKQLIGEYQALADTPDIWLVTPPPIFDNELNLNNTHLEESVIPCIKDVARELDLPIIDVNFAMTDHPEYFEDGVHPNLEGAQIIAGEIYDALNNINESG